MTAAAVQDDDDGGGAAGRKVVDEEAALQAVMLDFLVGEFSSSWRGGRCGGGASSKGEECESHD